MKRRVAIIGTGSVGASVAVSTLQSGVADELLLHDVRQAVAEGEAMDLAHGAPFYPPATVRPATIDQMLDADAVAVCALSAPAPCSIPPAYGTRLVGSSRWMRTRFVHT